MRTHRSPIPRLLVAWVLAISASSDIGRAVAAAEFGPATVVSVAGLAIREGTGGDVSANFVVRAEPPPEVTLEIPFRTAAGSALAGDDFIARKGVALIPPGVASVAVVVAIVPDALAEAAETFELILEPKPEYRLGEPRAVATLLDDDIPAVSAEDVTVLEGSGPETLVRMPVTLSLETAIPVSVALAVVAGTADSPSDFAATNGVVRFLPGSRQAEFVFHVRGDEIAEFDETVQVLLSNPVNATLGSSSARVTILDDDPTPVLSVTGGSLVEPTGGTSVFEFRIRLSGPSVQPVRVAYSTRNGTATAGVDYLARLGTLLIAPGDTEAVLGVTVLGDSVAEPDETFSLILRNPLNAVLDRPEAVAEIRDDDRPLSISVLAASGIEGSAADPGTLAFEVLLSAPATNTVVVNYATRPLSAAPASDFLVSTGILTFVAIGPGAGNTRHVVRVPLVGDDVPEPNERLELRLSDPFHAVLGEGVAIGEILNDDGSVLEIEDALVEEGDSDTVTLLFVVHRRGPAGEIATASYRTGPRTAGADLDYVSRTGRVTFLPGETRVTIPVEVRGDRFDEPNETFVLELHDPTGATLLGALAIGTIIDDDRPGLRVDPVAMPEGTGGATTARFTVRLDSSPAQEVSVAYRIEARSATAGEDYLPAEGLLAFPPGIRERQVSVPVLGDGIDEGDETFALVLFDPRFATVLDPEALATVVDDDPAPLVSIEDVEVRECTGIELRGSVEVPIRLGSPSGKEVIVPFQTRASTALPGVDFEATSGVVRFPPGSVIQTARIPLVCDDDDERDEVFEVLLGAPENAVLSRARARARILDDDVPTLSISDLRVIEGGPGSISVEFVVVASSATAENMAVDYSTEDGTAREGSDYLAVSGTLILEPGSTSGRISVSLVGDSVREGAESFRLVLRNPRNARLARDTAEAVIVDDDVSDPNRPPVLTLTIPESEREGTVGTSFRLSAEASDPENALAAVVFLVNEIQVSRVAVPPYDTLWNPAESGLHSVTARAIDAGGLAVTSAPVVVRVLDPAVISSTNRVVLEGAGLVRIPIALSRPAREIVSVHVGTRDSSAVAPTDYIAVTERVVFAPGELARIVEVPIVDDEVLEAGEVFFLELGTPENAVMGIERISVTIEDNEPILPTNSPPVVIIRAPVSRAVVPVGGVVPVEIEVTDGGGGVAGVELFVDGRKYGEAKTGPYRFEWRAVAHGDHVLFARVLGAAGVSVDSEIVRVAATESCGRVAIVRNVPDPEIEDLREYLFELGAASEVYDRDRIERERLAGYDLVIWHDGGQAGVSGADVEVLDSLLGSGMPFYFIGDRLVEAATGLAPETQAAWIRLLGMRPGGVGAPPSRVEIATAEVAPDVRALVRDGPAGLVGDFDYPFSGTVGTRSEGDRGIVLGRAEGRDVLVVQTADDSGGGNRRVGQSFRAVAGGDDVSRTQRRRLFQNAIAWLLGCSACSNVNLEILATVQPAPAPESGDVMYVLEVHATGACEALAVRLSCRLADHLRLTRVEVEHGTWHASSDRSEVSVSLGRIRTGADETVRVFARPMRAGTGSTRVVVSSMNERAGALDDNEVELSSRPDGQATLEIRRGSPGRLELRISGSPGLSHVVEASSTLAGPWASVTVAVPTTGLSVVPIPLETSSSATFYRVRIP